MTEEQLKSYRSTLVREIEYALGRQLRPPHDSHRRSRIDGEITGLKWALKWLDEELASGN